MSKCVLNVNICSVDKCCVIILVYLEVIFYSCFNVKDDVL